MKKKLLLILAYLLFFNTMIEISAADDPTKTKYVSSKSGLRMRNSPTVDAQIVTTLPYQTMVAILSTQQNSVTVGGVTGYWVKVKAMNKEGWVFDAYLSSSIEFDVPEINRIEQQGMIASLNNGKWKCEIMQTGGCRIDQIKKDNNAFVIFGIFIEYNLGDDSSTEKKWVCKTTEEESRNIANGLLKTNCRWEFQ